MYNNNPKGPQIIFRLIEIAFLGIVGASKLVKILIEIFEINEWKTLAYLLRIINTFIY